MARRDKLPVTSISLNLFWITPKFSLQSLLSKLATLSSKCPPAKRWKKGTYIFALRAASRASFSSSDWAFGSRKCRILFAFVGRWRLRRALPFTFVRFSPWKSVVNIFSQNSLNPTCAFAEISDKRDILKNGNNFVLSRSYGQCIGHRYTGSITSLESYR